MVLNCFFFTGLPTGLKLFFFTGLPTGPRFDPKRRPDGQVFVPNTNKHAGEGSNPIWMTGAAYDNVTFGFDDDLDSRYKQLAALCLEYVQCFRHSLCSERPR